MRYLILLLFPLSVFAKTITFTPPDKRMDNTPLLRSEISGYIVKVFSGGSEYKKFRIGNVTAFDVDYPPGKYGVYLRTIDTENRFSDQSIRYDIEFVTSNPKPPVLQ